MTIEEKAQRYNEALERARIWQEHLNESGDKDYAEELSYIFPDLKENEDVRVRKSLITFFQRFPCGSLESAGTNPKEAIDWLEKQDKQNPTDKVEPRFKIGDWVIFNENHNGVYQVERIDNNRYYLRHYLGGTLSVHFDNELIRLWTVQDAKDGDVLVDVYGNIGIFEKYDDFDWTSYCFSWKSGSFCHFKADHENEKTYPATQEQRDTLFKAMTDAGYTFNFKKKKLEKIEQNPTWSVEDEANFQCVLERINNNPLLEDVNVENYKCWLQSLKQRCTWKPSEGQMEAMESLIININRNPLLLDNYTQSNIRSLCNDLRKLVIIR